MSNEPKSENIAVEAQTTVSENKNEHPNESHVQTEQDTKEYPTDYTTATQGDEETPPVDEEAAPAPLRRRDKACQCLCCIALLLIIAVALGGGLGAWAAMGCFKAENKNTRKCNRKAKASKSDASFLSVKGSLGTYLVAFAFEVMLFVMF
ncbi:hypothetical protein TWF281_005300 [Arthrobotrys megalospora]